MHFSFFLYSLTRNLLLVRIHLLVLHSYLYSVLCSTISFWSYFITSSQVILGLMSFLCHTTKIVGLVSVHRPALHLQVMTSDARPGAKRSACVSLRGSLPGRGWIYTDMPCWQVGLCISTHSYTLTIQRCFRRSYAPAKDSKQPFR